MHFRIQPMPDETQRVCAAISSASFPQSRAGLITLAVFALVGVAAFLLARPTWAVTVLLSAGGILVLLLALQAEARWRTNRAQACDPHASEPYEIEVEPEGIRSWCAHVDIRYTWDGITSVVETPEFYLFLRGPQGGPSIPKRLLDAASEKELRRVIREYSPDRGVSLTGVMARDGASAA
jgi:hypothetical protein